VGTGASWKQSAFLFPDAFKTCASLWEGRNLVIPNQ
jgi:hypothetical protein